MRWCIPPGGEPLFGPARGCDAFEQHVLTFDTASAVRMNAGDDEVLYVLSGAGEVSIAGEATAFEVGTAACVPRGTPWKIVRADKLEILSVLIRNVPPGSTAAVIQTESVEAGTATAGRSFHLLASPGAGCLSATQFIGLIPAGRAPDHFHRYDEVIYVLDGDGVLEIGGEQAPLRPGTCIHLPRTLVHCLANTGDGEMRVLGVFTPAGSPAEAYYPDGTLAVLPERN